MGHGGPGWEVDLVAGLRCHRCTGEVVCAVRVPHSFLRADGTEVGGTRLVALCPDCDRGRAGAAPVIAYFRAHGRVVADRVEELAGLLREWVADVGPARAGDLEHSAR
ncbi:hypothetical protein UO65_3663 [Actinokineospora spheciospongiae]|uniref:Uncharacterized protein n=1 Tax=Actinokineospora spheciospongiae TaxID=909613 RepID=W7IWB7_9PSEU|nr:DUF6300 family protein [Actinokineospora spheciospongiae]EWC61092.1 hypothetical protein UO65_3663 [Actinokineospora spheciospongiae]PWW66747.1 hypothetical protein DFQ13_101263 [Actinokineospora spheciospongiae]